MSRPTQRAPKGRTRDRADRRAVLDVLLARAQRGILTAAEGALLAEHVREEQRLAGETRRAMAGTTQALARHREAADAAIVEAEARATAAEEQVRGYQAAEKFRRAAADTVEGRLATIGQHATEGIISGTAGLAKRAAQTEHNAREANVAAREYRQAISRVRDLARRMRAGSPQGAAAIYADRIDQALDGEHQLADARAALQALFLDRADSTGARLAEQQREHDIALATERRHTQAAAEEASKQRHRAGRYQTAWTAARRDRKADRAAMATELPVVQAARRALAGVPAAQFVTTTEQTR
ncbi:hypothetical protein [Streptomyces sp. MBT53]|uniref:hypothetical protein n=1 Tax=Streptomyces sp. MBT53 TaxID=1488384 RepID=UPI001914B883|nr:hypothetical protein [Streptomyces sp. MBT53]MBK6018527.1 hypothetical protein [Streptomyces sp. MBT53]